MSPKQIKPARNKEAASAQPLDNFLETGKKEAEKELRRVVKELASNTREGWELVCYACSWVIALILAVLTVAQWCGIGFLPSWTWIGAVYWILHSIWGSSREAGYESPWAYPWLLSPFFVRSWQKDLEKKRQKAITRLDDEYRVYLEPQAGTNQFIAVRAYLQWDYGQAVRKTKDQVQKTQQTIQSLNELSEEYQKHPATNKIRLKLASQERELVAKLNELEAQRRAQFGELDETERQYKEANQFIVFLEGLKTIEDNEIQLREIQDKIRELGERGRMLALNAHESYAQHDVYLKSLSEVSSIFSIREELQGLGQGTQ